MSRAVYRAEDILALQKEDGSWGFFHSLGQPGPPITTEQAIRRLSILGYTIKDEPIQRAVGYMRDCLTGRKELPDRREKGHPWDVFIHLMLSTWICRFTGEVPEANETAARWVSVISAAFADGSYDSRAHAAAFAQCFGEKQRGDRLADFVNFYFVSLLAGRLEEETEDTVFRYIINHPPGIYYIYDTPLIQLPEEFASLRASRYLGAVELAAEWPCAARYLGFAADWLEANRSGSGGWDMGSSVKDGVYFPLSENWRKKETREADCTRRAERLLARLAPGAGEYRTAWAKKSMQ